MKDINKNWKDYQEKDNLTTDSLWIGNKKKNDGKFIIPKRNNLPKNNCDFHGLFIPEIPYQFILRFTEENDIVWDCFAGSGTSYKVCNLLNRKCITNDINPIEDFIIYGDSLIFNPGTEIDLLFIHPPYFNIVKFSNDINDGSNKKTIEDFLLWFKDVFTNVNNYLKENKFCILVCGNIYSNSEEIELGSLLKDIFLLNGYTLKSHIIKDYGETKGKDYKNYNLNYVRQLRGNYNNFYGDNIYILQKKVSKNNIKNLYNSILK
jgi:DNA modification methylase